MKKTTEYFIKEIPNDELSGIYKHEYCVLGSEESPNEYICKEELVIPKDVFIEAYTKWCSVNEIVGEDNEKKK